MKSLSENWTVTLDGIHAFVREVDKLRSELVQRLERRKSPVAQDFEKLNSKPFYSHTSVLQEMQEVIEYNQLLNSMRLRSIPQDLFSYSPEDLRSLI
jgi:hypothetical protein